MKIVRIIFFCLIVLLALPELAIGGGSLYHAVRALGDLWSIRHGYLLDAAVSLIPGILAVLLATVGAFRPARRHNWVLFVFATGITLFTAMALPSWLSAPLAGAKASTTERMREIESAVQDWAPEHKHFPRTAAEVEEAVRPSDFQRPSPYQRGGRPVEYEVVTVTNATGPALKADKPGVVFYSVDEAGERYWITGTTLPEVVSDHPTMVPVMAFPYDANKLLVIEGKLEPPPPPAPPPTAKKK